MVARRSAVQSLLRGAHVQATVKGNTRVDGPHGDEARRITLAEPMRARLRSSRLGGRVT